MFEMHYGTVGYSSHSCVAFSHSVMGLSAVCDCGILTYYFYHLQGLILIRVPLHTKTFKMQACDCKCFMALPYNVMGWYVVVIVVFHCHTHLLFYGSLIVYIPFCVACAWGS